MKTTRDLNFSTAYFLRSDVERLIYDLHRNTIMRMHLSDLTFTDDQFSLFLKLLSGEVREALTFEQCHFTSDQLQTLLTAFTPENETSKLQMIKSLSFINNQFSAQNVDLIAQLIRTNESMTLLVLRDNGIDDEGVAKIAEALLVNYSLRTVKLTDRQISADKADPLFENVMMANCIIQEINFISIPASSNISMEPSEQHTHLLEDMENEGVSIQFRSEINKRIGDVLEKYSLTSLEARKELSPLLEEKFTNKDYQLSTPTLQDLVVRVIEKNTAQFHEQMQKIPSIMRSQFKSSELTEDQQKELVTRSKAAAANITYLFQSYDVYSRLSIFAHSPLETDEPARKRFKTDQGDLKKQGPIEIEFKRLVR